MGEWTEPGPSAHSQFRPLAPRQTASAMPHEDLGLLQKPHPVTRAHGYKREEAVGGRQVGRGAQKRRVWRRRGRIHELAGCDVVLLPPTDNTAVLTADSGKLLNEKRMCVCVCVCVFLDTFFCTCHQYSGR